jgi:hypothetical protein
VLSFFSSRWNWDSPNPSPARECSPSPFGSGGRGTLAGERGGGRVPIPTRGHTLWYSIYVCTLCVEHTRTGTAQTAVEQTCFYFCSMEWNSEHFYLPWNGSERNSESFLFRGTAEIPSELTICSVYSVFRGIIFLAEIANPNAYLRLYSKRNMVCMGPCARVDYNLTINRLQSQLQHICHVLGPYARVDLKGIVQPFELGGETRLIRSAVKYWKASMFLKNFLMIPSHERSIIPFSAA